MIDSQHSSHDIALGNQLLASLPDTEFQRLRPHLEWVEMPLGKIIYEVREPITHVYFPLRSIASLISKATEDFQVEFGLVGNEGLIGIPALLGGCSTLGRAIVQAGDGAMRIEASVLKAEFERSDVLQKQLLLYLQFVHTQMAQNVNCQVHHRVDQRFAKWLLSIQDRLQTVELSLTHKYVASLLGTRRATITEAAGNLRQAGIIQVRRGKIMIRDRPALEEMACECYALLKDEQTRLQAISRKLR